MNNGRKKLTLLKLTLCYLKDIVKNIKSKDMTKEFMCFVQG